MLDARTVWKAAALTAISALVVLGAGCGEAGDNDSEPQSRTAHQELGTNLSNSRGHRRGHHNRNRHGQTRFSEINLQKAVDFNPNPDVFETFIVAKEHWVELESGQRVRMFTYNGTVPGPQIRVKKGDRVKVHLLNLLPEGYPTTIHWHGVEVNNASDGTPVTQKAVERHEMYTYDFEVPREGVYWYHPHIRSAATTFQGLYGSLVVEDPAEDSLNLPEKDLTLVLSDVDVDQDGSILSPEHATNMELMNGTEGDTVMVNGRVLPTIRVRAGEPLRLRFINSAISRYFRLSVPGHTLYRIGGANGLLSEPRIEGGTITSSMNMAMKTDGSMQMLPPETLDLGYDRGELLLPTAQRAEAILIPQGEQGDEIYLMWKDYDRGRHMMDHGDGGMGGHDGGMGGHDDGMGGMDGHDDGMDGHDDGMGTMDEGMDGHDDGMGDMDGHDDGMDGHDDGMDGHDDGMGDMDGHDSMPMREPIRLMRLVIDGSADTPYTIPSSLRTVEDIRPLTSDRDFVGQPTSPEAAPAEGKRINLQEDEMEMVMGPDGEMHMAKPDFYIDGVSWQMGEHMAPDGSIPDLAPSARQVSVGDVMEWEVHNHTEMDHPFHAHGFSFQPIKWVKMNHHPENPAHQMVMTTYAIPHTEWADTWNIPPHTSLHYKVRFDARDNPDGTPGGSLGRWLYHCHIFQHAGGGMMSEFVVEPDTAP